jgi:hypothetical protein
MTQGPRGYKEDNFLMRKASRPYRKKKTRHIEKERKRFATANNRVSVPSRLFIRSDMISFPIASASFYFSTVNPRLIVS